MPLAIESAMRGHANRRTALPEFGGHGRSKTMCDGDVAINPPWATTHSESGCGLAPIRYGLSRRNILAQIGAI